MRNLGKCESIDGLITPFKEAIVWLEYRLKESNIHMMRWETTRAPERQQYLFEKKSSRAKPWTSPHQYGCAVDYVLDCDKVEVARRVWKSPNTGKERWVPFAWDTESPEAAKTWIAFGFAVRQAGLEWGGDWNPPNEHGIGWDYPHVQFKHWRQVKKIKDKQRNG